MIAYLDSSVLMRIILQEANPLREWDELVVGVSSVLISVEGYRTLDQLWHRNQLDENDVAEKRLLLETFLPRLDLKELTPDVLKLASNALPTPVRTLDALHLATAMLYRMTQPGDERPIFFATHDVQLAKAAKAMHFDVIGVPL
ncbi:MAG TPA: type II toxin-antitoxin system VapC family toxin [Thermoanaerobaculia bacterium]|nr:type II toxin-antitoxin system VapC family toxin [Thermoanaerobaculia bacterium]